MDGSAFPAQPHAVAGAGTTADGDEDGQPASSWVSRLLRRVRPDDTETAGDGMAVTPGLSDLARRAAAEQRAMLLNVIRMREQRVEDVMIPRADIVAAPESASLEDLIAVFRTASLTRVPVFRDTLDDPIGFVHLKDLAFEYGFADPETRPGFNMARHLRQPLYVPPSMTTATLLERMQASRKHLALVIDEYGGVDGLVTIEDLVEQIVGEIDDEHDLPVAGLRRQSDGSFIVDGRVTIRDLNRELDWNLPDEEATTIAGLVLHEAKFIPEEGQSFAVEALKIDVLRRKGNQLRTLRITPRQAADAGEDADPDDGGTPHTRD